MADMTDEEYDELDELLTRTTPKLTTMPGVFARQRFLLDCLDIVAANYIQTRAKATNQTPSQIIGQLVREKLMLVGSDD
ncbi:MAG: hypothetical protein LBK63_13645 [Treponema sp.]|jgi:hypothetical protein|nr:hypothetical protein [Treponema sp.]